MPKTKAQKNKVDISMLNKEQKTTFDKLVEFVSDENDKKSMFLVEGYAGTGKTFLITKFIEYFRMDMTGMYHSGVAMTAPTNKAVKVLKRMSDMPPYMAEFVTVHKLLGLKEFIDDDGNQLFQQDMMTKPMITNVRIVVVDEVSMLPDKLFHDLLEHVGDTKIIFTGDPCQIPPVNEKDSIPLLKEQRKKYHIKQFRLTEIMRQKDGNPIIETSMRLRKDLDDVMPLVDRKDQLKETAGVVYMDDITKDDFMVLLKEYFKTNKFDKNPDYCKVIGWRNVVINRVNEMIRGMLYHEPRQIMVGEKLIADKPIIQQEMIMFQTSDEFTVTEVEKDNKVHEDMPVKFFRTTVSYWDVDMDSNMETHIKILDEGSKKAYEAFLDKKKRIALSFQRGSHEQKKAWRNYFREKERYAEVKYNYCITAHKSQGSTYENVIMLESDMDRNINVVERNRIKYTALTRASDKAYILTS